MYTTKIGLGLTFEEIANRIQGEEADGFVFVGCTPYGGAVPYNAVSFEDHPTGDAPPRCKLQAATANPPAAHRVVWAGKMLVGNIQRNVVLYRPK